MRALVHVLDCQVGSLLLPPTATRFELLVLVRSLFPLVPVTACLALAVVGHLWSGWCLTGLVGSAQMWYWISFMVVAYPFATVFGTHTFRRVSALRFVLGLLATSVGISLFEASLASLLGSRELAWAAGYSLYTVLGLLAVPMFFYADLEKREWEDAAPSATGTSASAATNDGKLGSRVAMVVTMCSILFSLMSTWSYTTRRAPPPPPPAMLSSSSLAMAGTTNSQEYDDWLGKKREHEVWQTFILYMLPAQALVFLVDRKRKIHRSFAYCVFYSVLGTRIPDFLAYSTVHIFMKLGAQANEVAASRLDQFYLQFANVGRFTLSMGYMGCMSLYMRLLSRITNAMSTPTMYPRFMFHAQLYFYTTYYVLVSSASRDMDALFWAMTAALNLYYVLSSTGLFQEWRERAWTACWEGCWRWCCQWWWPTSSSPSGSSSPHGGSDVESSDSGAAAAAAAAAMAADEAHVQLLTRIQLADQDALADVTALLAVPTLVTAFAVLAAWDALDTSFTLDSVVTDVHVEHYNGASLDIFNLWMRFGVMFLARLVSSRASRFIFRAKMNKILAMIPAGLSASRFVVAAFPPRKNSNLESSALPSGGGMSPPPLPPPPSHVAAMDGTGAGGPVAAAAATTTTTTTQVSARDLQPFPMQSLSPPPGAAEPSMADTSAELYPYYLLVSVHSMYSLFQNPELPARYAFCAVLRESGVVG